MVLPPLSPGDMQTSQIAPELGPTHSARSVSPKSSLPSLDCMALERDRLNSLNLSETVVTTLLTARKLSTKFTYHRVWRRFQSFSTQQGFSFRTPLWRMYCLFLVWSGCRPQLQYHNTIKVQVLVLSALTEVPWAKDQLAIRFLKAAIKILPRFVP